METIDFKTDSKLENFKYESVKEFINYIKQKGLEHTSIAPEHHKELARSYLKSMLKYDTEILELLYKNADDIEREMITGMYKELMKDWE